MRKLSKAERFVLTKVEENCRQPASRIAKQGRLSPEGVIKIIKRLEQNNLKIAAMKLIRMTKTQAQGFYAVHEGKPFFDSLTDFMCSGPIVVMVLQGENVIVQYRKLMGATNYKEADEGTIRRDFATSIEKNIVHGSDSTESAAFEIGYFFNRFEIVG